MPQTSKTRETHATETADPTDLLLVYGLDPVLWTLRYGSLCRRRAVTFIRRGALVVEGRMRPPRVVPRGDVIENRPGRLGSRVPVTAIDQLAFECREETLRHRVVPTIAAPT